MDRTKISEITPAGITGVEKEGFNSLTKEAKIVLLIHYEAYHEAFPGLLSTEDLFQRVHKGDWKFLSDEELEQRRKGLIARFHQ